MVNLSFGSVWGKLFLEFFYVFLIFTWKDDHGIRSGAQRSNLWLPFICFCWSIEGYARYATTNLSFQTTETIDIDITHATYLDYQPTITYNLSMTCRTFVCLQTPENKPTVSPFPTATLTYGWMKFQRSVEGIQQGIAPKRAREEQGLGTWVKEL